MLRVYAIYKAPLLRFHPLGFLAQASVLGRQRARVLTLRGQSLGVPLTGKNMVDPPWMMTILI